MKKGRSWRARLEIVLELGRAFNSTIGVDRLLELIADRTAALLEAERCSIYIVDGEKNTLWTKTAMGSEKIEIPIGTGIAGAVARTGGVVNVPDAYADERFNREVDRATGYRTRNILAGPMFARDGEVLGVFQLLNSTGGQFTDEDEELLDALSGFAGSALENAFLYEELKRTFHSVLEVLAATIDAKHHYTAGHTARVARFSRGIAEEMGLPADEIEVLDVAAYLHDYGKIAIADSVLTKPGRLTAEEFTEMKKHASKTRAILSRMHFSKVYEDVPLIAGSHHERYDGSGYPQGLAGGEIPRGARIMIYADVLDALISDRDYRAAMPLSKAFSIIESEVGTTFDPEIFPHFERFVRKEIGDPRV